MLKIRVSVVQIRLRAPLNSFKMPQSFLTFCLRLDRRFGVVASAVGVFDRSSAAYGATSCQGILTQGRPDKLGESE